MPEKVVIDGHELWHGDAREVLPLLAPVDLVLFEDHMKHLDLALATIALSIAVAAISYFSKDGAAAAFVGMVGMVFIWVNK